MLTLPMNHRLAERAGWGCRAAELHRSVSSSYNITEDDITWLKHNKERLRHHGVSDACLYSSSSTVQEEDRRWTKTNVDRRIEEGERNAQKTNSSEGDEAGEKAESSSDGRSRETERREWTERQLCQSGGGGFLCLCCRVGERGSTLPLQSGWV